jgi:transcriptional regulator with XRE-family HTH domain
MAPALLFASPRSTVLKDSSRPLPQPVKSVLVAAGVSQRTVARLLGLTDQTLSRILNTEIRATPEIKAGLSALTGLPEELLFHAEARPRRSQNGSVQEMRERVQRFLDARAEQMKQG